MSLGGQQSLTKTPEMLTAAPEDAWEAACAAAEATIVSRLVEVF
jgi:hypothetical protein